MRKLILRWIFRKYLDDLEKVLQDKLDNVFVIDQDPETIFFYAELLTLVKELRP